MILLAVLASLLVLLIGISAEGAGLHRRYQANTVRTRRVLVVAHDHSPWLPRTAPAPPAPATADTPPAPAPPALQAAPRRRALLIGRAAWHHARPQPGSAAALRRLELVDAALPGRSQQEGR